MTKTEGCPSETVVVILVFEKRLGLLRGLDGSNTPGVCCFIGHERALRSEILSEDLGRIILETPG